MGRLSFLVNWAKFMKKSEKETSYNIEVAIKKGNKLKVREFVERTPHDIHNTDFPWKNPEKQTEFYWKLRDLNKNNKKNGKYPLHIIPTFRLVNRNGKKIILSSKLNVVLKKDFEKFPIQIRQEFFESMNSQISFLNKNGWVATFDSFLAVRKNVDGELKIVPMLVDFNLVYPKDLRKGRPGYNENL